MSKGRRLALLFAAVALVGALANLLLGPSPAAVEPVLAPESPWTGVSMRVPDLVAVDARWQARAPWGQAPRPVEPEAEPVRPPLPVGVVGSGGAWQAIFLVHDAGELRVAAGDDLPDGGRVLTVDGRQVSWIDGSGQEHSRTLFVDPQQFQTR